LQTGIGVESTGHCHPKVVSAIAEQAGKMIHTSQNLFTAHMPMVRMPAAMPPTLHLDHAPA
jgi:4-aminobutyrate aminotransferase